MLRISVSRARGRGPCRGDWLSEVRTPPRLLPASGFLTDRARRLRPCDTRRQERAEASSFLFGALDTNWPGAHGLRAPA